MSLLNFDNIDTKEIEILRNVEYISCSRTLCMVKRVKRIKKDPTGKNSAFLGTRNKLKGENQQKKLTTGKNFLLMGFLNAQDFFHESNVISFGELPEIYDKYNNNEISSNSYLHT